MIMNDIDNSGRYKIEVSGFDIKIILESLKEERIKDYLKLG